MKAHWKIGTLGGFRAVITSSGVLAGIEMNVKSENADVSILSLKDADLSCYVDAVFEGKGEDICGYIVSDLHGNCMKAIYVSLCCGTLKLPHGANDYNQLNALSKLSPKWITRNDVWQWCELLFSAEYPSQARTIYLGDDLGDRQTNDIWNLLFYWVRYCKHDQFNYAITESNHSDLARRSLRAGQPLIEMHCTIQGQYCNMQSSLDSLWCLIDAGVVPLLFIQDLIDVAYEPFVSLVCYHVQSENKLLLYMHARASLFDVRNAMRVFGIVYDDSSIPALITALDALNAAYREFVYTEKPTLSSGDPLADPRTNAIAPFIWKRNSPEKDALFISNNAFEVRVMHGHLGEISNTAGNGYFNLDTNLGKHESLEQGTLLIGIEEFFQQKSCSPENCSKTKSVEKQQTREIETTIKTLNIQVFLTRTIDENLRAFVITFREMINELNVSEDSSVYQRILKTLPATLNLQILIEIVQNKNSDFLNALKACQNDLINNALTDLDRYLRAAGLTS